MKKVISGILIVALVVGLGFVVAKDVIIKIVAETAVTMVTGFKTSIKSIHYDFPTTIQIQGLRIENPSEFNTRVFVDIPEIYSSLVLSELLKGKKVHLQMYFFL